MRPALFLTLPALVLQAQAPDLAPVLQATRPDVDRLITALQPKIALDRARSILPAAKPAWTGGDFSAFKSSTQNYRALAGMYLLQGRAAQAAGAWEDAQQAYAKGLAIAQENQVNYGQNSPLTIEGIYKATADAEAFKKDQAAKIKDMLDSAKNIKANPLEILKLQQAIKEQEDLIARSRESVAFVSGAKKDLAEDIQSLTEAQQNLDKNLSAEKATIAAFNSLKKKTGYGPWVAAALLDKANGTKYPTAPEQSALLHRLAVLDPANAQVPTKLDGLRQGKLAFAPAKAAKAPAKTAKKKK
jgi:hypothetical protein